MQKQKSKNINFRNILLQQSNWVKEILPKLTQYFFVIWSFLFFVKPDFFDPLCILLHAHKD